MPVWGSPRGIWSLESSCKTLARTRDVGLNIVGSIHMNNLKTNCTNQVNRYRSATRAGAQALACWALLALPHLAHAQHVNEAVFEGDSGWVFPAWENLQAYDHAAVERNAQLIASANQLFRNAGIHLAVAVVPTKGILVSAHLPANKPVSSAVAERYAHVQKALSSRGVTTVDLRPALEHVQASGIDVFYRTDYHWTAFGSEAAAAAVSAVIKPFVKGQEGKNQDFTLGEWVHERHYGDLASKFLPPHRLKALGRERFTVRLPISSPTKSLLDDDAAPVHVMGNSFVQPYWGFSQKLSFDVQATTSLTWNAGSVGQWVIALLHAESQLKQQTKPQVLVWQMNEAQVQIGPDQTGTWDANGLQSPTDWLKRLALALQ